MKKTLWAVLFALASAVGFSMSVYGATQTTSIPVSLTVGQSVSVSATSLDFGTAAPGSTVAANATITVNATSGLPYTVTIDRGTNAYTTEYRIAYDPGVVGGESPYYLYKDAALTQEWGDAGFANMLPYTGVAGTGSGADQPLTVYGIANAASVASSCSDFVTVTVHY